MKKTIFLSILLIFITLPISARELKVESFEPLPTDLTARTEAVIDLNGNKCALIKVALPKEGARFLGNVLKEEFFVNEYRVYLSQGSKDFQVMCPGVESMMIDLRPYTAGKGVESGMTYQLRLSGYEDLSSDNQAQPQNTIQGNYLILEVAPKSGVVEIDGNIMDADNGKVTTFLGFGPHEISVRASGYSPYRETVTITAQNKTVKTIQLESLKAHLRVNPATPSSTIKINGKERATGSFNEPLAPGNYIIEVEKEGYRPYVVTIELAEKERRQLDIPALEPIYVNLDVDFEPYGANITIDGKSVGTTPEVVRDILIGTHNITITMEGYLPYSDTLSLQEGNPARLEGALKWDDHGANGHEFVDLGLSVKWAPCNVGASKPSDFGNYYAWGETQTKDYYWDYNSISFRKDFNDIEGTIYDVAYTEWGARWRMPTKEEFQELIDKCKWKWIKVDGINGYRVTGPNGNAIFLPAAGYSCRDFVDGENSLGYYWSSAPGSIEEEAWYLYFNNKLIKVNELSRSIGRSVRPVLE